MEISLPSVTAIIVSFNPGTSLRRCINAILDYAGPLEVIIADNGSTDDSLEDLPVDNRIHVEYYPDNPGFGGAVNQAAIRASGEVLLILNPDLVLSTGSVLSLARECLGSNAIVGPGLLVEATGRVELGATINHLGMPSALTSRVAPLYVPGCAMAIPRGIFKQLGGFDYRYFLFVEDVELCWRALLSGVDVRVSESAEAVHEGGSSLPGGYPRTGHTYQTSEVRIALRERNTMALMLSCAPVAWLPVTVPAIAARTIAFGAWALLAGRSSLARALFSGLAWNMVQLRSTIARRRSIRREPRAGYRQRITHSPLLSKTILHHRTPTIK